MATDILKLMEARTNVKNKDTGRYKKRKLIEDVEIKPDLFYLTGTGR